LDKTTLLTPIKKQSISYFILSSKKNIHLIEVDFLNHYIFEYDEARMIQLFQNIWGNTLKTHR
jgi:hypothetical protein